MWMNVQGPLALRLGRLSSAVAARRDGEAVDDGDCGAEIEAGGCGAVKAQGIGG
jgi:hypothetical protein